MVAAIGIASTSAPLPEPHMKAPPCTLISTRGRLRGGDGGHRGVRSIIETFQDDRIGRVKIGGQTGDILGATQQLAEIAGLLVLAALA